MSSATTPFDLAIIGGGINGTGIARDAAGRGWRVLLAEQADLAAGTSSASTKLIHGGLRYLEYYEFRLVREALKEREVLWGIAPHIVWPLRFVLPYQPGVRPAWMVRLGLFLYDHIGGRQRLPPTRTLLLDRDEAGVPLKNLFRRGYEYSDCWVEDSRLVVLNARDAAARGAQILTRTRCVHARHADGLWRLTLSDGVATREVAARAIVNAAGPWVDHVVRDVMQDNARAKVRLVKGSHIVVPRLYEHERCYIFQNADRRIIFAIPFQQDFTLIGTTDRDYTGDPAGVHIEADEASYLCAAASEYFREPVRPESVVWSYSGVRPLYDDGASAAQEATRDYVLDLELRQGAAVLNIFGGKITTYRRLALAALEKLAPHLPPPTGLAAGWTATAPLPGGDFPRDGAMALATNLRRLRPALSAATIRRLVRAYGTEAASILEDEGAEDMLAADLSRAELRHMVRHEWVHEPDDVLWRRSKIGLVVDAAGRDRIAACL
ncbi:MAG: glycerol-3-phosphate dehydrogenase [Rhodospirillales bacterium]|nr:glycerol-3-phosphate dehydrogenase [Rhodospirillales bacterium]